MTHRPGPGLDAFETALLAELKGALPQPAHAMEPPPARLRRPRGRWSLAAAAVAVAALAGALLVPGLGPTPAYAVTGRNDGEIHVKVNRLEGADGLERALADRGIAADISYLPAGKECAAGRYTEVNTPGLTLSVGLERFEVTIPAGAVGTGDTFVLDASVFPVGNEVHTRVSFGIGHGPVAPCRVVDSK